MDEPSPTSGIIVCLLSLTSSALLLASSAVILRQHRRTQVHVYSLSTEPAK